MAKRRIGVYTDWLNKFLFSDVGGLPHYGKIVYMRVLLVGPSPEVPGGIGSLMQLKLNHPPEGVEYVPAYTLTPDTSMADLRTRFGPPLTRLIRNFFQVARVISSLPRTIRKNGVVGAHVHFSVHGSFKRKRLVCKQLAKIGTPYILHAHGGGFDEYYDSSTSSGKKEIVRFINSCKGFISLSSFWHNFYAGLMIPPPPKMYVLPNPVLVPDTIPDRVAKSRTRFLFLGRIGEHKGSDRVIRAVALLPEEIRKRVEVWLAGDGDIEGLRRLVKNLCLEEQVVISGWIGAQERDRWLSESDCFILPSRAEGMPMAILEALAWGLPVISSPVGGIPEMISHGQEGLLVPPDDIQAVSDAIRLMVEKPAERDRMGYRARQRAQEFALPNYRAKLRDIYVETFGG